MTFQADLAGLQAKLPDYITAVTYAPDVRTISLTTTLSPPHNQVSVLLSQDYVERYPRGAVHFLVGQTFNTVSVSSQCDLLALCRRIHEVAAVSSSQTSLAGPVTDPNTDGMGDESSSTEWVMEPTVDFQTPNTGGGGFYPQMSAELLQAFGEVTAVMTDYPTIKQCEVTLLVDLSAVISDATAKSFRYERTEKLQIRVRFDREKFFVSPVQVVVGQQQNFKSSVFFGLCGQLQSVLQRYCDVLVLLSTGALAPEVAQLLKEGFDEGDVREVVSELQQSKGLLEAARKLLLARYNRMVSPFPANISEKTSFFQTVANYVTQRVPTIADFCVICDRPHEFGSGMVCSSVCTRSLCSFKFQTLHVAKDITDSVAIQTGVVDLLINFAKAASQSGRWELIFNPFPQIFSDSGTEILSDKKKDVAKAREILQKIPKTQTLFTSAGVHAVLAGVHPLASAMFQWIISSNKSVLVKLDEADHVKFMGTSHQFALLTTSDEREKRFEALKQKHGAFWCFHGSNHENWHSILRNGLKNASGTKLQANGAAYGSGIYLSPHASVSFGYSQLGGNSKGQAASATDAQFIDIESMHCIAICEVAKNDLRQNGNIWVQPNEDAVVTRFFFVYTRGMSQGYEMKLDEADPATFLTKLASRVFSRK